MNELQQLEVEILGHLDRLTLRPTLDLAREIGERLERAKKLVGHGKWTPWLGRIGIRPRTAQVYMQVAKPQNSAVFTGERMSLDGFLRIIRLAKRAATRERYEEAQAGADAPEDLTHRVVTSDCRKFKWPKNIDCVVADPEWTDLDAYRWTTAWAASHLREGGICLVQCGVKDLPEVMATMQPLLTYVHLLNLCYGHSFGGTLHQPFQLNWRPVILYAKGQFARTGLTFSDTYTVRGTKEHHPWQQPLKPFVYWLGRLTRPGELIADPYAGSGTIGVACKQLGRRYLGTEINPGHARTARRRIAEARVEPQRSGSPDPDHLGRT